MNKVTPKAGQVWACSEAESTICNIVGDVVWWGENDFSTTKQMSKWNFIPQNDLEWLAVNVDEWYFSAKFMYKHDDTAHITGGERCHDRNTYNRQQWQNMRYELGLDEKPQKETKMIDLSTAVVGDKFNTIASQVTLVNKSNGYNCLEFPDGSLMLARNDGSPVRSLSSLKSKVDPRHWLKDLPDAGLFVLDWVTCDDNGTWVSFDAEPEIFRNNGWASNDALNVFNLRAFKMPKLTGNEWRDSKISIVELRAWQEQNK